MTRRPATALLGIMMIVAGAAITKAQDCPEPVGRWPYGVSNGVAAEGDRAVLVNGAALQVLDLTVPSAPSVVGEVVLPREIRAVAIAGAKAYAITHDELCVVDLGGPVPTEIGTLPGGGNGYELAVEGDFVYVLNYRRLSIIDVSDPTTPTLRGEFAWSDGSPRDLEVVANHAFIVDSDVGLRVVDVSDPTSPMEIAELYLWDGIHAMQLDVANGFAYVVGIEILEFVRRLFVIDLTDPAQPDLVASPTIGGSEDIVVREGIAAIASFEDLYTYDISNPQTPTLLGSVSTHFPNMWVSEEHRLAAIDGHVLIASELHGLTIIDVTDPTAPAAVAAVGAPGKIGDATFADGVLYIAADDRGLRVIDVTDPAQPDELGFTSILQQPGVWGIAVEGDIAYTAAGGLDGLFARDVSNPAAPVTLGNAPGAAGNWVTIDDGHAYVVNQWGGRVSVVSLSSPAMPVLVGSLDLRPGSWEWPVVVGDHLIIRDNSNDAFVAIYDVSDPTRPFGVSSIELRHNRAGLAVTGSWLLVPDATDEPRAVVRIFDMRDPAVPVETDPYYPIGGYVDVVAVAGSVAYFTLHDVLGYQAGGIEAVNFADPTAPVFMDLLPRSGYVERIAFSAEEIFVFDHRSGFDTYALCHDPLFADDFETGNASAWSVTAP